MKALITRPRQDAAALAVALLARGIEPIVEPLLDIRFLPDGASRLTTALRGAQAALFTSANGVRAFAAASPARRLPAFAVGPATATAARAAGFPLVMSAGGTVADLGRLVIDRVRPADGALVHAAGRDVAGDLAGALGAAGFTLRRLVLYEAVPALRLSAAACTALAARRLSFALFFSPRTATTFVRLVGAAGLADTCRDVTAIVAGPAVAQALAPLAWRALQIAESPAAAALLAALDRAAALADPAGRQEAPA